VRRPLKEKMKPSPDPAGLAAGPDGRYRCADSKIPVERIILCDPSPYDPRAPVEAAYVCAEHGSYWYAFEPKGNVLKEVYGPFKMRR
jgi:hypothetical protein